MGSPTTGKATMLNVEEGHADALLGIAGIVPQSRSGVSSRNDQSSFRSNEAQ